MTTNLNLFPRYANEVTALTPEQVRNPISAAALNMGSVKVGSRNVQMVYAPFDHVNPGARIAIVGLTPGKQQAVNALLAAWRSLQGGRSLTQAAEEAKVFASFSGPMRSNLVRMLDTVGVADLLGLSSTAALWNGCAGMVHFTSALRYPVFVDGANWSGQPNMLQVPQMRSWLETYTGAELASLSDAIIVPLGPKVAEAMLHLANNGQIDERRILTGLPHPSGANAERIAYFLGNKPAHRCSTKTNTAALDSARDGLRARVSGLTCL